MSGVILITVLFAISGVAMLVKRNNQIRKFFVAYVTKKGEKIASAKQLYFKPSFLLNYKLTFDIIFSDGCKIDTLINRLYGMSFGFDPENRSISIGWRYEFDRDVIQLYVEQWVNKEYKVFQLTSVSQYESFTVRLWYVGNRVTVMIKKFDEIKGGVKRYVRDIDIDTLGGLIKMRLHPKIRNHKGTKVSENVTIFIKEK